MAVKRPWRQGLRPVPGSYKLMALRWLLFVVAGLPALAVAMGGMGDGIADRPYFAEAPDPLPMAPLMRVMGRIPGVTWGLMVVGAVAAWLGNLMLTAGAVSLFGSARGGKPQVWRTLFAAGSRHLWSYLRIALFALVLAALGARLIGAVGEALQDHARQALWTLDTRYLLQLARGAVTACWLTLVGVFAWWCRVIVVADERRRVRRLWTVVPRLWKRRPWGALGAHFLLAIAALGVGSWVVFAWRQSPAGGMGWTLFWLVVLAGLSFLWHWRLRAGRLLWSSPELLDLRAGPDAPWRLPSRLFARLRRRKGPSPAPADA